MQSYPSPQAIPADVIPARMVLNFKNMPYRTEWVEYPDISPKFKSLGIPPNPKELNAFEYSIPAMRVSGGECIMDSLAIAKALEAMQPQPPLHLDNGYIDRTQGAVGKTLMALAPMAMPRVPVKVLREKSQPYFNETREKRFGMPLSELAKSEKAQNAWQSADPGVQDMKTLLHEHEEGPYLMGDTVSFADFILAGMWRFIEILDEGGDLFGKMMKADEAFPKHYEACKKWMERDGH